MLSPFYRYRNEGTDGLSNLAKVTQWIGHQTQSLQSSCQEVPLLAGCLSPMKLGNHSQEAHGSPATSGRAQAGYLFL